jgi:hypothetical protein
MFHTVSSIKPSSGRSRMGIAHRDGPRRANGRSGAIRNRPDASAAGVRPVRRRLGYNGRKSSGRSVG